ncbi:MAG: hypothetical protein ACJ8OJ_10710 [Povalibacter sp.]
MIIVSSQPNLGSLVRKQRSWPPRMEIPYSEAHALQRRREWEPVCWERKNSARHG